jgi:hypothetical protein
LFAGWTILETVIFKNSIWPKRGEAKIEFAVYLWWTKKVTRNWCLCFALYFRVLKLLIPQEEGKVRCVMSRAVMFVGGVFFALLVVGLFVPNEKIRGMCDVLGFKAVDETAEEPEQPERPWIEPDVLDESDVVDERDVLSGADFSEEYRFFRRAAMTRAEMLEQMREVDSRGWLPSVSAGLVFTLGNIKAEAGLSHDYPCPKGWNATTLGGCVPPAGVPWANEVIPNEDPRF